MTAANRGGFPLGVRWSRRDAAVLLAGGALAAAGGVLTAATLPWAGFAVLLAAALLLRIVTDSRAALITVVSVMYLLPFGVIPIPLGGVRLTMLDASLSLALLVWLLAGLARPDRRITLTPAGPAVLLFIGLAVTAFLMAFDATSAESARLFLKLLNSILLFFTVVNIVRSVAGLQLLARTILAGAGGAAALALAFYVIPSEVAGSLLASLARIGYPENQVLRYIADTTTLRATGTAVDPNVLGGMLLIAAPLAFTQAFSPRPALDRRLIWAILALILGALVLSYSRGSWLGALVGVVLVGAWQYRRILAALALALCVLLATPQGALVVERFQDGLAFEDRASQMRLGEYKDALRLIERYPLLGVGFGRAPEIDIYVASSSIYFLMASQMGLIGLGGFLATMGVLFRQALGRRALIRDPAVRSLQFGAVGSVAGALAAGLFDHFFFNMQFPHTVALFWLMAGLAMAATEVGAAPVASGGAAAEPRPAGRPAA